MTNKSIRDYINLIENAQKEEVEEGLVKDIKRLATGKDVKTRAGQEISKAQQASMTGDNKTAHKHFKRYDKLDKLANKEQGVAEGTGTVTASSIVNFINSEINRYYEQDNDFAAQWLAELVHNITDSRPGWKKLTYDEVLQGFIQYDIDRLLKIGDREAKQIVKVYNNLKQQLIAKFGSKQGVEEEQLEETSPEAIAKIEQLTRK
jgi:NAD-dependent DNA ligase